MLKRFQKIMRNLRDDEVYRTIFIINHIGYIVVMLTVLWVFCSWHDVVNGTNWVPINIFEVFIKITEYFQK